MRFRNNSNNDINILRRRLEAVEADPPVRPGRPSLGAPAMTFVVMEEKFPRPTSTPCQRLVKPARVSFVEKEGAAVHFVADDGRRSIVTVLNSYVPTAGAPLIARLIGGRWVSTFGGAPLCDRTTIHVCNCVVAPYSGCEVPTGATVTLVSHDGKTTIGPLEVPKPEGTVTLSRRIRQTKYTLTIQAPDYETIEEEFVPGCPDRPQTLLFVMDPVDGKIIMAGHDPFDPPDTLTLTDPLGSTTLNFQGLSAGSDGFPKGTAYYCGSNTFGDVVQSCSWVDETGNDTCGREPEEYHSPRVAITYWLAVGCRTRCCISWRYNVNGHKTFFGCGTPCNPLIITPPGYCTQELACGPFQKNSACGEFTAFPNLMNVGLAYFFRAGASSRDLIHGEPIDLTFDQQFGDDPPDLSAQLSTLYGIPFGDHVPINTIPCQVIQISE